MMPPWATFPMVALATVATVIASQALISGAFSATKQTIQLGYLPRLTLVHTSSRDTGQIYIPAVNWALLGGVLCAVLLFGSSDALAAAYGISVSLVMVITTVLTFFVIRYGWKLPLPLCMGATTLFLLVDVSFFSSNLLKIVDGGWFPLLMAAILFFLLATWKDGRRMLKKKMQEDALALPVLLKDLMAHPPIRVEGTAVFLTANPGITPSAFLHNLKHNKVLHAHNLFLTVEHLEVPRAPLKKRVEFTALGFGCWQVIARFGFMEDPDVPKALHLAIAHEWKLTPMTTSYFLSRDIIVPTIGGAMSAWREKVFAQMHKSAGGAADFLNIPNNSVIELGAKIEI
jgi:KUP system potassium uptake protein